MNVFVNVATGETRSRAEGEAAPEGWIPAARETNTMPQWAGSCWYYLRYLSPDYDKGPVDPAAFAYWKTPDFYIGGAEHAVLHLLYARFWHRFLYDIGVLSEPEPFRRLFHQGIILGEDGEKMSKSRGNVVNPDDVIKNYGADALRIYLMALGPLEAMKPWNTKGIEGPARLLRRIWRAVVDEKTGGISPRIAEGAEESSAFQRVYNRAVKKISEDIESLSFNTAITQFFEIMNALDKEPAFSAETARGIVRLLAPFAPHIAEELWERLGGENRRRHADDRFPGQRQAARRSQAPARRVEGRHARRGARGRRRPEIFRGQANRSRNRRSRQTREHRREIRIRRRTRISRASRSRGGFSRLRGNVFFRGNARRSVSSAAAR